ncbi:MAG: TMEM165/GDT1 family protein [Vallitalea sp.]|nr:TMEM165/GDT1 family protein [Vallitalea sp.]
MLVELIKAFSLIFIAEMGDKTQIMAMAFATRFKVKQVLVGIFLGSLLNHGLAVIFGNYLCRFIPTSTIQMIAGFAFVGFALWTLKIEEDTSNENDNNKSFGPVLTVATAFFIGELGDKTQLTAITLSADAQYPLLILFGCVFGMLITGALGILVGKKIGNKMPKSLIKVLSASIFMLFGLAKLFMTVPAYYLKAKYIIVFLLLVCGVTIKRVRLLFNRSKERPLKYAKTWRMFLLSI